MPLPDASLPSVSPSPGLVVVKDNDQHSRNVEPVFQVLSGCYQGARMNLQANKAYRVGSGYTGDIILMGSSLLPWNFTLMLKADGHCVIVSLHGELWLGKNLYHPKDVPIFIAPRDIFCAQGVAFCYGQRSFVMEHGTALEQQARQNLAAWKKACDRAARTRFFSKPFFVYLKAVRQKPRGLALAFSCFVALMGVVSAITFETLSSTQPLLAAEKKIQNNRALLKSLLEHAPFTQVVWHEGVPAGTAQTGTAQAGTPQAGTAPAKITLSGGSAVMAQMSGASAVMAQNGAPFPFVVLRGYVRKNADLTRLFSKAAAAHVRVETVSLERLQQSVTAFYESYGMRLAAGVSSVGTQITLHLKGVVSDSTIIGDFIARLRNDLGVDLVVKSDIHSISSLAGKVRTMLQKDRALTTLSIAPHQGDTLVITGNLLGNYRTIWKDRVKTVLGDMARVVMVHDNIAYGPTIHDSILTIANGENPLVTFRDHGVRYQGTQLREGIQIASIANDYVKLSWRNMQFNFYYEQEI